MFLMIGIMVFVFCRKSSKRIIGTAEEMKRELGAPASRLPGSVAIDVAPLRHSILADENEQFGENQNEELIEQEGAIGNVEEGELVIQAEIEGVMRTDKSSSCKSALDRRFCV